MKIFRATKAQDVERVKPVALQWKESCNGKRFGIRIDPETHFADLVGLVQRDDADLFLLVNEKDEVVGYMGVTMFNSPLSNQKIAQEHYWYATGRNRGRGTMLLIKAVKQWAKERGCTHFIMNASCLASNMHDRLCQFYTRMNFRLFETSFIKEI